MMRSLDLDKQCNSDRLFQRAVKVLPGGNSRHTVFFRPHPFYAVRGEGAYVWDADNTKRIDLINNYSALIHGHSYPGMVEAITSQAKKLVSVALPTEEEIKLSEIIASRVSSIEQVRFCNSGTEAVNLAIRAARAFTKRAKIAKIEGAYHGSSDIASVSLEPTSDEWGSFQEPNSVAPPGVPSGTAEDIVIIHMNDIETARKILRKHSKELAGVIIDPMVKFIGPTSVEFVKAIQEEVDACGALLIFDEVYSFRLGYGGMQGELGIVPDLTALGKMIGGGLPVGAVGGRSDIMATLFDPREKVVVTHGGTFNANPMTMAAGVVAMSMYDQEAVENLNMLGDRLRDGLREAFKIINYPGVVGGEGSLIALYHSSTKPDTYRDLVNFSKDQKIKARTEAFFNFMLNNGIFMDARGLFALSTVLTNDHIDFVIEKAIEGFSQIKRSGL